MNSLSERDKEILDFERTWWQGNGAKEAAVRERFGLSGTRYFQALNRLLDDPAALAYAPTVVNRLRRHRVNAQRARSPRRLGLS